MEPVVTAVVPSFRGAGHLEAFLAELLPVLHDLCGELVLVDDCSDDETWSVMKEAASNYPSVTCMRLARRSGQQVAILAGCTVAAGGWIVTLDDDLEHDPAHIPGLISLGEAGYDLVYAVPRRPGVSRSLSGFVRRAGSIVFGLVFTLLIGKPLRLKLTSFRALKAGLVRKMLEDRASAVYVSALALRQRPRVGSMTVTPGNRAPSRTSLNRLITTFARTIFCYGPIGRVIPQPKVCALLPIAEVLPAGQGFADCSCGATGAGAADNAAGVSAAANAGSADVTGAPGNTHSVEVVDGESGAGP